MGYEDGGIGGAGWEAEHGRACLPAMILHPVKEGQADTGGRIELIRDYRISGAYE